MELKWLHAPGHVGDIGPNVIKYAKNLNPLVVDWSEMMRNVDDLHDYMDGYTNYVGPPIRRDARGRNVGHDVAVSVRNDAEIMHREHFFISAEVKRMLKYFPERHGKAVVFNWDGVVVLLIAWHPHPVPFKFVKLVLPKYRRGVARVQEVQDRLVKRFDPDLVLNGGDLQLPEGPRWAHPNQYARRNQMTYRYKRIDWQMWKANAKTLSAKFVSFVTLAPQKINRGMDHPWLMLTLSLKKK